MKKIKDILARQITFGTLEAYRVACKDKISVMQYMVVDLIYLFVISLDIMLIFNINYFIEVNTVAQLENPFFISFYKTLAVLERYSSLLYVSLVVFVLIYIYVNIGYVKLFIKKYSKEIGLILKIKGPEKTSKVPIFYLAGLINFFSCILVWILSNFFYRGLKVVLVNLTMLDFFYFRITLFLLLLFIAISTSILTTYYLFWRIYNY